ncbi:BON domain-containing protein [Rhodanobacter aciditrophus]|uniref:BON domain-containing protein n=1 Tax=Rhodanobacter aciditrophus TaxID=1623218 RepID=UPI003CF6EDC1
MSDKELRQLVIDELEYEPSIDAADIGVAAENGVVTLSGHVSDYAQKTAAERAAWRVKGVRGIAQEIEVRLSGDKKRNDDEIAQRALSILAWNTTIPSAGIRVQVSGGWVTLSGNVSWNYQRRAAENEIRKLGGVTGVTNDIRLTTEVQASDLKRRIQEALKRHAEIEAGAVHVDVRADGTVRLDGHVDNWSEMQAVERAVWAAPGVRVIEDNLIFN